MPEAPFWIRPMADGDAEAVAAVHLEAWRETYPGIMPADLLASLTVEDRLARRRSVLARRGPDALHLVGVSADGRIVGFLDAGPARAGVPGAGEVHALYLLDIAKGRGLGRGLMEAALGFLFDRRLAPVAVDVAAGNGPARAFYERMGGRAAGEARCDSVGGHPVASVFYLFERRPVGGAAPVSATSPPSTSA